MISLKNPKHLLSAAVLLGAVGFFAVQMFFSLTPPRHADHDHAMASLDASGFLRVESADGTKRNLVGRPNRVLVLHFFDPRTAGSTETAQAARFASGITEDPQAEILFVARADSWESLKSYSELVGIPPRQLYLDKQGKTSDLLGVKRWPETLIYAADGLLAFQAKGPMNWSPASMISQINRAKAGVEEIH